MTRRHVHVVGTGTIGEPLIGLLCRFRKEFGIDEVTFHKRTPIARERAKVEALVRRGAKLVVDSDVRADFEALGHKPAFTHDEALARAHPYTGTGLHLEMQEDPCSYTGDNAFEGGAPATK